MLRFRAIPDSLAQYHLEESECCLIHVENTLTPSKGVWINPHVRVTYTLDSFYLVHGHDWMTPSQQLAGIWQNRLARWSSLPRFLRRWAVTARMRRWEAENTAFRCWASSSTGPCVETSKCVINEMQVLREDGWAHV